MFIFALVIIAIISLRPLWIYYKLKKTTYRETSGNTFWDVVFDKGIYGEFEIYSILEECGENKILCNVYLPKANGETTEIDLISINSSGIFVYESKNYSGWIFGNESNLEWTQTFKSGQKFKFYNPISQNKGHIKAINALIGRKYYDKYFSYIIFSDRCELRKVAVKSQNVKVFNLYKLDVALVADKANFKNRLTAQEVDEIYCALKQHTLVSDEVKKAHIKNIKMH